MAMGVSAKLSGVVNAETAQLAPGLTLPQQQMKIEWTGKLGWTSQGMRASFRRKRRRASKKARSRRRKNHGV